MSLKQKISRLTFFTILSSLLICSIFIGYLYQKTIEERNRAQITDNMEVVADRVSQVFSDAILCSNYITLDINNVINRNTKSNFDRYTNIMTILNSSLLIFENVDSVVFVDDKEKVYYTSYDLYPKQKQILDSPYYESIQNAKNGVTVLFDYQSDCMNRNEDTKVITMGKRIININTKDTIGYLFINISVAELNQVSTNEITSYYICDSSQSFLNPSEDKFMLEIIDCFLESEEETIQTIRHGKDHYLIGSNAINHYNWQIIGVTNLTEYNLNALQVLRFVFISLFVIFILMSLLENAFTSILTKPLEKLMQGAEEIGKGNLDTKFHFKTNDEIGRMGEVFNNMTDELSSLLKRVDEEAKQKRHYELALVQEQIKPHFLYNSLDIILVLIEMNKPKDAIRATRKLATYYKNTLSSSAEIIPLDREFQILTDYLDLQLIRYQDQFTYSLDLPQELENLKIPKMTLQPLVENALYHGLKLKEGWGSIQVSASETPQTLILTVKDDGIGMTKSTLEQLMNWSSHPVDHFGVYSVLHRLKLYYGDNCSLDIQSTYYEGTEITISIPKAPLEDFEEL